MDGPCSLIRLHKALRRVALSLGGRGNYRVQIRTHDGTFIPSVSVCGRMGSALDKQATITPSGKVGSATTARWCVCVCVADKFK